MDPSTWLTPTHFVDDDDPNIHWTANVILFLKNKKKVGLKCKKNDWQPIMSILSAPDNSINGGYLQHFNIKQKIFQHETQLSV